MFTDPITLNPTSFGGANVNKAYSLVGWGGDTSTKRRVAATALTTPEDMMISHRVQKDGTLLVDQHMVRLDTQFTDPIKGVCKLSSWLVIRVPQGTSVVTLQEIKDQVGRLIAFEQSVGALDKILNNEP
ncbi:TPA_asm: coat protein [ssRNA phage SRR7976310_14]|uniref:Coat protein n=1 Tax=ssRNA phage SRR7976310_14 TaxID=2786676 RepID=A0A8S5L577_9VIRU|nr:coat protein [ssRNA phage SRR7976310_14]DAD52715.1 TPA_asm: coat protein [ssRNA phage SRR7976310_14]